MPPADIEKLDSLVAFLRKKRGDPASIAEVTQLAEVMADMLHDFYRLLQSSVHGELKDIADYIERMQSQIAALRPSELRVQIPAAENELAAVVQATEIAVHSIMERAETVMSAEFSDLDTYKAFVNGRLVAVIEACSFQDLTGQRITKVIKTLSQIEERITRFAAAARVADAEEPRDKQEQPAAAHPDRLMLNGPSAQGEGNGQDDVDFLLEAKKPTVSQADVDKLFG